jgi:arsenate reductase
VQNNRIGENGMNIQIFGKAKCFDTKKAERYFKERKIKFQSIDLAKFGMSKGEFNSVKAAVGGLEKLIDENATDSEAMLIKYLAGNEAKEQKLLENPKLFKTPIVRNGKQATIGYQPEVWKAWE